MEKHTAFHASDGWRNVLRVPPYAVGRLPAQLTYSKSLGFPSMRDLGGAIQRANTPRSVIGWIGLWMQRLSPFEGRNSSRRRSLLYWHRLE